MGNYEQLKQAVSDVIKTNGNQEITGAILQNALLTIISTVGNGATFAGIATPGTNPGTPDQNIFYIASNSGVYTNFDNIELNNEVSIISNKNGNWQKIDTGIVSIESLKELENGSGKIMQLPYSFEQDNKGANFLVRANDFTPATVYGIVYYANSIGYFDLYSLNKENYAISKLETVLAEKVGINYYLFETPFTISDNIILGYVGTIIGIRTDSNVLGMWQSKVGSEGTNTYFNRYEACYGIITSEIVVDNLINKSLVKNNSYLAVSPIGNEFSVKGLKDLWRGNRIESSKVYSILVYSEKGDYLKYAMLDVKNKTISDVSERIYISKGWNYIQISNTGVDVDIEHCIVVSTEHNESIPINNITPCVGLIQFKSTNNSVSINNEMELSISYVTNRSFDRYIANEHKSYMPFNSFTSIDKYKSSFKRANDYPDCKIKGITLYSIGESIVEYGLMDTNQPNYPCQKIGEFFVRNGINTIYFDESVEAINGNKIYISNATTATIGVTNTNGIGFFQSLDDAANYYKDWEVAYGLILENSENENENKYYELKYGEIITPKDIYIATGTQCNLWWSSIANICEGDKSIYFDVTASDVNNVYNAERVLRIESGNEKNIEIEIVSRKSIDRSIIDTKKINIHIVPKNSGSGNKGILMCGDSRTWQRVYGVQGQTYLSDGNKTITTEVKKLLDDNKGATFTFYGTFQSALDSEVKNLAESGWKYDQAIQTINSAGGIKRYIEVVCGGGSGATLDYCTCMYGINDLMDWNSKYISQYDYSTAKIDGILAKCKEFISLIKAGYPNCKIIIVVESTTCANQDGFAYWDGNQTKVNTHVEVEKAQKLYRKRLIEMIETDYADDNNVILSSAGIWCDRLWGFPYTKTEESSRCANEKIWFRNNMHPHDDGYKQIADGIFSTIKYLE